LTARSQDGSWAFIAAFFDVVGWVLGLALIAFVILSFPSGRLGDKSSRLIARTVVFGGARPGVLLIVTIGGWLLAAIVAGGVAVLLGDALHTAFGSPPDGTPMGTVFFVFILSLMGMVGGVVGGSIEGAALDRRLQSR
jgi:MFS family permease